MEIPRHWRLKQQRYLLVGEICPRCDAKLFPPRAVCPECGGETGISLRFSGKAEVYSYTILGVGKLMKMAVDLGRSTKKHLHIGICGEQGGDPSTIKFCHDIGLDYVSCSCLLYTSEAETVPSS